MIQWNTKSEYLQGYRGTPKVKDAIWITLNSKNCKNKPKTRHPECKNYCSTTAKNLRCQLLKEVTFLVNF